MARSLDPESRALLETPWAVVPEVSKAMGNPAWEEAPSRILIVRLSPLRDVAKSSSHLVLFSECRRSLPAAYLDFAFLPARAERALLADRELPWFYGLESGRGPADFDLVLVSNAFALELLNLPYLFSTAGLPSRSSLRIGMPGPLVALGGSNAAACGSVVIGDPPADCLVDGIFFGEGEGAIGDLASILADRDRPAADRLEAARGIEGFWPARPPARGTPVPVGDVRRRIARPGPPPLLDYPVLATEEAGTARLQISAGCPGSCSFCLEGWDRRPYRELPLARAVAAARELRIRSGADTLELYSFNFNAHEEVFALLLELGKLFRRVNLMSQRLDILASTPGLLAAEKAADKRSYSLGIEGISARMRSYYRKGVDSETIESLLDRLVEPSSRELKLFYVLSGWEGPDDLSEFRAFAERLGARRGASAPGVRIVVSAGFLVRLPFTPLQYAPLLLEEAAFRPIVESLTSSCAAAGLEFRLAADFAEYAADQVLALGGSALAPWIEELPRRGFVYDGGLPKGAWESLESFARGAGLMTPAFLEEKPEGWVPPLGFLDSGTGHAVLRSHYEAARGFEDAEPCLGGACSDCGACPEVEDRAFMVGHRARPMPSPDYPERIGRLLAAKAAFAPAYVLVDLPASLSGAVEQYRASWLLRLLSVSSPGAERVVFEARELPLVPDILGGPGRSPSGWTVFALYGPDPARAAACAAAAGLEASVARPAPERVEIEAELPPDPSRRGIEALAAFLAEERIAFREERTRGGEAEEAGERRLVVADRDLKKRMVLAARYRELAEGGSFVAISLGSKGRIGPWLDRVGRRGGAPTRLRVASFSGR